MEQSRWPVVTQPFSVPSLFQDHVFEGVKLCIHENRPTAGSSFHGNHIRAALHSCLVSQTCFGMTDSESVPMFS